MARQKYRNASEIGEFVYCHRAWWLHHIQGREPMNRVALDAGRAHHARHGNTLQSAVWMRRVAIGLLVGAVLLMGVAWYMGIGF